MGVCNCSMFCCRLLYVHSSIVIILMGKRELIALLNSSSWCLVMVERLFLAMPRNCLRFVIVVFPDHTHLLFLISKSLDIFDFWNLLKFRLLFLISFLICLVSQGGPGCLQMIVLFGTCFLANFVMQVVTFSAYVSMLSCFNICQSVCWISSRNELKSHLSYNQMCRENVDFTLLTNFCKQSIGQW